MEKTEKFTRQIVTPRTNNLVVGIKGLKGSGKTAMLTLLLYFEWKYLKKKVYTNYQVFFPHESLDIDKLIKLDKELTNAVIGISELHMICDSRRSGRKQNIKFSYFVTQSRHRSVNLYYDTQFERQIDIRIRENTDINLICENLFIDSDGDGINDMFRVIFQDKRTLPPLIFEKIIYLFPVFGFYNTDYIVNPFTMKEIQKIKGKK